MILRVTMKIVPTVVCIHNAVPPRDGKPREMKGERGRPGRETIVFIIAGDAIKYTL